MVKKPRTITESSAAQYLTFVASSGDDAQSVEMRYEDENIWLTQKMIATLYGVSVSAINQHIKTLSDAGELDDLVIKQYLITAVDGKGYQSKASRPTGVVNGRSATKRCPYIHGQILRQNSLTGLFTLHTRM